MLRKIEKDIDETMIANEWNKIAEKRNAEIKKGNDQSLLHILYPKIEQRIKELNIQTKRVVVDCGCGSGYIANRLSPYCSKIVGIDISDKSIEIAKSQYKALENVEYRVVSIEEFGKKHTEYADICIANMVLSNIVDCKTACDSIWNMLKQHGRLLITIPHPCFWPEYWGYSDQEWFHYKEEICMSGDFSITGIGNLGISTHIHRPIDMYLKFLSEAGFTVIDMEELYSKAVPGKNNFKKPRFMFIEGVKD